MGHAPPARRRLNRANLLESSDVMIASVYRLANCLPPSQQPNRE
jgi:hypothetical protein